MTCCIINRTFLKNEEFNQVSHVQVQNASQIANISNKQVEIPLYQTKK
jgi:hypothetical protein